MQNKVTPSNDRSRSIEGIYSPAPLVLEKPGLNKILPVHITDTHPIYGQYCDVNDPCEGEARNQSVCLQYPFVEVELTQRSTEYSLR